ncbi:MAG: DUF3427 domain-containing protein [Clostridia bacterium]
MVEGIYEEIINNKIFKELEELDNDKMLIGKDKLDSEEAKIFLSQYICKITKNALQYLREDSENDEIDESKAYILKQIELCNEIIDLLKEKLKKDEFEELKIAKDAEVLSCVFSKINNKKEIKDIVRPATSISQTTLFTGSKSEPSMLDELKKEIASCDEIKMLVSFIKWSGLIRILDKLKDFTNSGNKLTIITTSYMGATDYKAIIELSKLQNTTIKISYDTQNTRLHAKTYIFKRNTGFTTAYVGSSNMSGVALTSGLEWNVKISEKESMEVLKKIDVTFESYLNSSDFSTYTDSEENREKLYNALNKSKITQNNTTFDFDITPYEYQKEILENLQAERDVFNRYKNLVVAATGVGKTAIAGFDYKRFREENKNARLLFIAHREEILKKSRETFGNILKDLNFGELMVGDSKPSTIDNLFISIQSFNSSNFIKNTNPDFYDYIVIDEFHHAAAESYQKVLEFYKPKILLGLTATPERMDGKDILKYFDDVIASEMRLPEAIDNQLLVPFQYFGVTDSTDLSQLKWTRGGYDISELEDIYVDNAENANKRAKEIILATMKYTGDIESIKGLGFCVGVKHAKYMCAKFNEAEIKSIYITGDSDSEFRKTAMSRLKSGEIKFIFTVDLYNEGVDIPEINTVLFLRPTQSLTIFLQQLGRGLRKCKDKDCLTVLDFIGQSNSNYNFEEKFVALAGKANIDIKERVEKNFPLLPRGCYIELEKLAKEYVLKTFKSLKTNTSTLREKIKNFVKDTGKELTLKNFLAYYKINIVDFYKSERTFTNLCISAGILDEKIDEKDEFTIKRMFALLTTNSPKLMKFAKKYIKNIDAELSKEELILEQMLYYTFYSKTPIKAGYNSTKEAMKAIIKNKSLKKEILEMLEIQYENINCVPIKNTYDFICPLEVHCTYSRAQILAGIQYYTETLAPTLQSGVLHCKDKHLDAFFITLNKTEKEFSIATMYEDYAKSENIFHWQTQNTVSSESKTAERYINKNNEGKVSLFVREYRKENGIVAPYIYLGEAEYVNHEGSKPVSFDWRLLNNIPAKYISGMNKNIL